jgi:hypothetical protein
MKQIQHTSKTTETLETYICNIGEGKAARVNFGHRGVGGVGQWQLLWSLSIAGGGDTRTAAMVTVTAIARGHLRPRGLDSVVLAVIPVVVVDVGVGNGGDCTVCLAELEPEEL